MTMHATGMIRRIIMIEAVWFGIVVAFIFISAIVSVYAPAKRIRNMAITETINEW